MTTPEPAAPKDAGVANHPPARLHRGWVVGLVVLIVGFLAIAAEAVFHFADTPLDGPFQLFNGLRRLADGQRLGGTFQVFHGVAVPYLHLIPFYLFGGDFLASELSRQLVSIVAAIAVLLCFFRAWTGTWRSAIPISVIALCALIPLRVNALLFPINSMLGFRSTMPLVIGIHLLLRRDGWRASLERSALFALALACGVEQGMAAMAAYVAVHLVLSIRRREISPLVRAVASVVTGILLYCAIVFVMSPSGFGSVMRYNFKDVPGDQFWYFGSPPNQFLFEWVQLLVLIQHPVWTFIVFAVAAWCLMRFWRGANLADAPMRIAEAFLVIYALLSTASMLGTFNSVYFQPAVRVGLFLGAIGIRREWLLRRHTMRISDELRQRMPLYATLAVVGYAIAGWPRATISVIRTPVHIVYAHVLKGDRPSISADWQSTEAIGLGAVERQAVRVGHRPVLWSTYASLLEWRMGVFHPSFDYIIHALGHDNRVAYDRRFAEVKPDLVQTLRPTYTMYEEWLEVHHWDFYRTILRNYTIDATGPWSYFWTRSAAPFNEAPQIIAHTPVPRGLLAISLDGRSVPKDSIGLFEVRLFYHVVNPTRKLPVIGSLPRYLIHFDGTANHFPISLAPYETMKSFPVVTVGPSEIRMIGSIESLIGGQSLVFDSIHVERFRIAPQNMRWAADFIIGPPVKDTTDSK